MLQLHAHTTRCSPSSNTEFGTKNHRAGPSFADIALASDADDTCISEADLIAVNSANEESPLWEHLPSQYTDDGCVDEAEFNTINGLGIKHARAVGECVHRFSVSVPLVLRMSRSSCFSTIPCRTSMHHAPSFRHQPPLESCRSLPHMFCASA